MSRESVDRLTKRIADQHKSMGKEVNSREVRAKAEKVALRNERRSGSKR